MYSQLFTDLYEQKEKLTVFGRTVFDNGYLCLSWSASGLMIKFRGSRIVLFAKPVDTPPDAPTVLRGDLDGVVHKFAVSDGREPMIIDSLTEGEHTLRLLRISAGNDLVCLRQLAVSGENPAVLDCPVSYDLSIEFLGDSITCGYGNLGTRPLRMPDEEDASLSYAWLTGEALNADTRLISWSGQGFVHDCSGNVGTTFGTFFPRLFRGDPDSRHDFSTWQPDIMVINGGTNDAGGHTSKEDFYDAGMALYHQVRSAYPKANIVFMLGAMGNRYDDVLTELTKEINATDNRVYYFPVHSIYDDVAEQGANTHPSVIGHRRIAGELTAFLKTIL